MNIVVSYDQPLNSLPNGFTTTVAAVAAFYQSQFTDNITFNLHVGYGEVHGSALDAGALGESVFFFNRYSYSQIRTALIGDAKTGDDSSGLGNLPATDPISGPHQYAVAEVQAKALGLLSNSTTIDEYIGFSNTAAFDFDRSNGITAGRFDFYGAVAHELAEVMGKNLFVGEVVGGIPTYTASDLFHYSSLGVRDLSGTTAGYFSINGGATNLDNFNTNPNGDFGDWAASAGNDSWLAFSAPGVVNAVTENDLRFMDVIGFDRGATVAINDVSIIEGNSGTKTAIFTVTRSGGTAAFDVNFATADGSATAADGDYVATSGTLHFGVNVNSQTISVTINGDTKPEPTESFFVNLSAATNGTTIADGQGLGSIIDDDTAVVSTAGFAADHFGNFNGDGANDFLWRNTDGSVGIWLMNGGAPTGLNIGAATADWHIEGTGDFNGDNRSDVLWHNDSGAVGEWQMNGAAATPLNIGSATLDWHIQGTGDFNGDNRSDILWRSDNGAIGEWQMNGAAATPLNIGTATADWHIIGIGDFNGDGRDDLLWRNDSGLVGQWQMNGAAATPLNLGSATADWHIEGTGDFNGDNRTDILWRNDSGAVGIWQMSGSGFTPLNVGSLGAAWHIEGTGDVNGDGRDDIIWRNDNGQVTDWLMNGNVATPQNPAAPDLSWNISAHHFDLV